MIGEKIEKLIRRIVNERGHPCLGKVEKTFTEADKYFAEVRELDNEGNPTDTIYMDVRIPKLWGSENGGIWMTPSKGAIVLLSFLNGDRNYPIISSVLGGATQEEHPENTLIIKQGDMELRLSEKVVLKNSHGSLGEILSDMADKVAGLQTIGAPAPHSLSPAQIIKWKSLKEEKIKGLFE
ncbi:MAG: hypothetical protein ACRCY4_04270 [Brevinema sp.]